MGGIGSGNTGHRAGPLPKEGSARSDARGFSLTALPSQGYAGEVPTFPLPKRSVYTKEWNEAGKQVLVYDHDETERVNEREADLWSWMWSLPQACAWSMPSEAWRLNVIALYCRTFVICESGTATAADKGSLHRLADQIGMTTAGLAQMGWKIAVDQVAEKRAKVEPEKRASSRDRLAVVPPASADGR